MESAREAPLLGALLGGLLLQEAHCGAQTGDAGRVGRASLVAVGAHVGLLGVSARTASGPACDERLRTAVRGKVENAGPLRPEHALVPGTRPRVDA